MSKDINLTEGTVTEVLNDKVDIDFQNVPTNSVSFARCSKEVTNCIIEAPQRIKYTLVDGVLTILKGTVVIVPYGVEDRTSEFPKGSTFIHENFKVYDTQFADGKFFVWAEIQSGIVCSTGREAKQSCFQAIRINYNSADNGDFHIAWSGSSVPTSAGMFYNTDSNIISYVNYDDTSLTESVMCFPITTSTVESKAYKSVDQVFNGMGYIGSTIWVDKGVKGLAPNGRNEDGTIKNSLVTTQKVITRTWTSDTSQGKIAFGANSIRLVTNLASMNEDGYLMEIDNSQISAPIGATYSMSNGTITSLKPLKPLLINDICDSQWVLGRVTLASDVVWNSSSPTVEYDLSDFLPKDDYNYEVLFATVGYTGSVSGNFIALTFQTDMLPNVIIFGQARTRTASSVDCGGCCVLPVGSGRKISKGTSGSSNANGTYTLYAYGYRRLGKNV